MNRAYTVQLTGASSNGENLTLYSKGLIQKGIIIGLTLGFLLGVITSVLVYLFSH